MTDAPRPSRSLPISPSTVGARRRGRRHPFRLALGLLLIAVAIAVVAWPRLVRPVISDATSQRIRDAAYSEVARAPTLPPDASGEIVVRQEQVNRYLRRHPAAYRPLTDPRLSITPDQLRLSFELYGTENALTGRLGIDDGHVVLADAEVDGPAKHLLTADDAAALIEERLEAMLGISGLRVTAVRLGDGTLTITTEPTR